MLVHFRRGRCERQDYSTEEDYSSDVERRAVPRPPDASHPVRHAIQGPHTKEASPRLLGDCTKDDTRWKASS